MIQSKFFSPGQLGPLQLRNRSVRAAAFEGMCQGNSVTQSLIDYHVSLAKGGVALATVAYASVSKDGLSFPHQLLMNNENIPALRTLTSAVHREGAMASIQIGHCGNMANKKVTGLPVIAPTGRINWYGPTFPRRMTEDDIRRVINDFRNAVSIADSAGFDAVEVHAGHGYLISQFLSPYTNKRDDEYGGRFENRARFMCEVLEAVRESMPERMAMLVKMNCYDGFVQGITEEEGVLSAKMIEQCGADAVVVSGGFVSRAPMYVMRGGIPVEIMAYFIRENWKKIFVKMLGKHLIPSLTFKEGFFMEQAVQISKAIKIPVVLVGGMNSMKTIETAMNKDFEFIAMARALIENPGFVNDLKNEVTANSGCTTCNYCVAKMYSSQMECHLHQSDLSPELKRKIAALPHG